MEDRSTSRAGVDPVYSEGTYFADRKRHAEDAEFKATGFLELFAKVAKEFNIHVASYADVGCGSGEPARIIANSLRKTGHPLRMVRGYDVSPHALGLSSDGVEFIHGDFGRSTDYADLVTLFDVFEHVVDPIGFIGRVAERSSVIGFHIPLDDSLANALRNRFRRFLSDPGHILFVDTVAALNLMTLAGLRTVDYEYSLAFQAPSGRTSVLAKIAFPVRALLGFVSPWLLSKTLGGASLHVVAFTPTGLQRYRRQ